MSTFAVIREAGPGWRDGGIHQQSAVDEHAAFMNALADSGFLLFAGPLAGTEHGRVRVLLIVNADDADEIHRQLADDPWATTEQLVTVKIEPWQILVGAARLASAQAIQKANPTSRAARLKRQIMRAAWPRSRTPVTRPDVTAGTRNVPSRLRFRPLSQLTVRFRVELRRSVRDECW